MRPRQETNEGNNRRRETAKAKNRKCKGENLQNKTEIDLKCKTTKQEKVWQILWAPV